MKVMHAAILAGGLSTRMGSDKALLVVGGVPMLERMVRAAGEVCPEIIVVGRERPVYWPAELAATFIPDAPGISGGPMAGLIAALEHTRAPVVLLACDLPLLTVGLLSQLIDAHDAQAPATIATTIDEAGAVQVQPTFAIYSPEILPTLREMAAANRRGLHRLIHTQGVRTWPVPPEFADQLLNVNDAAGLAAAEARLQK